MKKLIKKRCLKISSDKAELGVFSVFIFNSLFMSSLLIRAIFQAHMLLFLLLSWLEKEIQEILNLAESAFSSTWYLYMLVSQPKDFSFVSQVILKTASKWVSYYSKMPKNRQEGHILEWSIQQHGQFCFIIWDKCIVSYCELLNIVYSLQKYVSFLWNIRELTYLKKA